MKKICIFSAAYLPGLGGVERYTYYVARELISRGNEVCVVTSDIFRLGAHEVTPEGIEVFRLPCINALGGRYPIYKHGRTLRKVKKALKDKKFDFVMVNTRFYFHSLLGAAFAHKNGIPCITVEHGTSHLSVNNKALDALGGVFEHFITALLKRHCKDFYGVSHAACEWSAHFNIKSKGVLYNAVDFDGISRALENPVCSYRAEYAVPKGATVITYTGRLIPEKGIFELNEAVSKLGRDDVYVFFAGDGPSADALDSAAGKNTFLLGRIDFEHVCALLKESDIFCLPSVSEGMSTSVLEAAACGAYVITTENGGSKELIVSGETGTIIKNNSVELVLEALERAIANPEERARAAEKARERVKREFTFAKTADDIEKLIK